MNYVNEIILRVRISKKYRKILFFFFSSYFLIRNHPLNYAMNKISCICIYNQFSLIKTFFFRNKTHFCNNQVTFLFVII